jgi:uncharacterized protein (DUF885 family)
VSFVGLCSLSNRFFHHSHTDKVRLVVDTGMHAFGWSVARAEEYMRLKTGMTEAAVAKEIRRYVCWPGQACSYKIGQLEILRLRRLAEESLGAQFDLRAFHTVCLTAGPLTLSELESLVLQHIQSVKGQ